MQENINLLKRLPLKTAEAREIIYYGGNVAVAQPQSLAVLSVMFYSTLCGLEPNAAL